MADGRLRVFVTGLHNLKESRGWREKLGGCEQIYHNWRTTDMHRAAQSTQAGDKGAF